MSEYEKRVGQLYVDDAAEIHTLIGYCDQPTVTFESLCGGYRNSGAVGSRIADEYSHISTLDKAQLVMLIQKLSDKAKHNHFIINDLKFDLADYKTKYADLRMEQLDKDLKEE